MDDTNREHAQRAHDRNSEFYNATNAAAIKAGEEAVKAGILMNGGSSVAMLTFMGTLASRNQLTAQQIALLAGPLIWFAAGVVAAVVCACLAYLTNMAIARTARSVNKTWQHPYVIDNPSAKRWRITGEVLRWVAIASMIASVGCFISGIVSAKLAFEQLPRYAQTTP